MNSEIRCDVARDIIKKLREKADSLRSVARELISDGAPTTSVERYNERATTFVQLAELIESVNQKS